MMKNKVASFTEDDLVDALQFADSWDMDIRTDYIGRGMLHEPGCFGVVSDDVTGAELGVALVLAAQRDNTFQDDVADEVLEIVKMMRTDSMGTSTIYYFPGWELADS